MNVADLKTRHQQDLERANTELSQDLDGLTPDGVKAVAMELARLYHRLILATIDDPHVYAAVDRALDLAV